MQIYNGLHETNMNYFNQNSHRKMIKKISVRVNRAQRAHEQFYCE